MLVIFSGTQLPKCSLGRFQSQSDGQLLNIQDAVRAYQFLVISRVLWLTLISSPSRLVIPHCCFSQQFAGYVQPGSPFSQCLCKQGCELSRLLVAHQCECQCHSLSQQP